MTDAPLMEGAEIEITVRMPSEITLGSSMPVRCRGRILRVVGPGSSNPSGSSGVAQTKIGVAVRLECYEYLPERIDSPARMSVLHSHHEEEDRDAHGPVRAGR